MNYVTHFKHPEQRFGDNYIRFYCGMQKHVTKEKYFVTENRDEVTCIGCLDRIDNPVRALKSYGDIMVCRHHISMRPLPHTKLFASAQRMPATDSWNFIVYRDDQIFSRMLTCHTTKQAVSTLLKLVEDEMLKQNELCK